MKRNISRWKKKHKYDIRHFNTEHRVKDSISSSVLEIIRGRLHHVNHFHEMFNFKHSFKFLFWSKIEICVRDHIGKSVNILAISKES